MTDGAVPQALTTSGNTSLYGVRRTSALTHDRYLPTPAHRMIVAAAAQRDKDQLVDIEADESRFSTCRAFPSSGG